MKKVICILILSLISTLAAGSSFNRIHQVRLSQPYIEVCFKGGKTLIDIHEGGESTDGGSCIPKDIGFIIERKERELPKKSLKGIEATHGVIWTQARQICLQDGMRLPEPFEWQLSCYNDEEWGLSDMYHNWEWASNTPYPVFIDGNSGMSVIVFGEGGCDDGSWLLKSYRSGQSEEAFFRCAL